MSTALDDYLKRQADFDRRIAQTRRSLNYWRKRGGLAPGVAVAKVRDHERMIMIFEKFKRDDHLPWES